MIIAGKQPILIQCVNFYEYYRLKFICVLSTVTNRYVSFE